MRTVNEVLGNHGGPLEYTTRDGKQVKIYKLTMKLISAFEQKMTQKAIKNLTDAKNVLDNDTFRDLFKDLLSNISAGIYAFGGEASTKYLQTISGFADLVSIMTGLSADDAMDLCLHEKDTFIPLIDEVVKMSVGYNAKEPEEESEGEEKKDQPE